MSAAPERRRGARRPGAPPAWSVTAGWWCFGVFCGLALASMAGIA